MGELDPSWGYEQLLARVAELETERDEALDALTEAMDHNDATCEAVAQLAAAMRVVDAARAWRTDGSQASTAGAMAGLDAAIEAGARELWKWQREPDVTWDELVAERPEFAELCVRHVGWIVRAAYPHIRRAVLNEAADDLDRAIVRSWSAEWLRERAEEGGG